MNAPASPTLEPDDTRWSTPPTRPDGGPVDVRYRVGVERIGELSTTEGTAAIRVAVTFYWTDPRLRGWSGPLPGGLWGPLLALTNPLDGDFDVIDEVFGLTNEEGRLKRGVVYRGKVTNPMQLDDFPFDGDTLDLDFHSSSHWRSLDGARGNMATKGRTYELSPVEDPKEGASASDPFCRLEHAGVARTPEWDVLGYWCHQENMVQVTGIESTDIRFSIVLARKAAFYFWRVLFPLYLITMLNLIIFAFPPSDFDTRIGHAATLILTSVAMLYVISSLLPKLGFLTRIDKVVVATLGLNVATALESVAAHKLPEMLTPTLDSAFGLLLLAAYVGGNLVLLMPGLRRARAWRKQADIRRFAVSSKA